jgi:hypothetical protein
MTFQFEIAPERAPRHGTVVYRVEEYSFDVDKVTSDTYSSILVNDLNLEVDERGNLLSVWGLCPHPGWQRGRVCPPSAPHGAVRVRSGAPLYRGISVSLTRSERWPAVYDTASGWLAVGTPSAALVLVEFVTGAILGLDDEGSLRCVWLRAGEGL